MHVYRMYVIKLSWSCEAVLTLLKLLKSYAQHRHRKRLHALQKVTNQTKGSKDGKSFDVGKTEFNEAKDDDDDIEAVPLVLQIGEETERKDLHNRLRRKDRREDLTIDRQLKTHCQHLRYLHHRHLHNGYRHLRHCRHHLIYFHSRRNYRSSELSPSTSLSSLSSVYL